jgi:hypothetical protein
MLIAAPLRSVSPTPSVADRALVAESPSTATPPARTTISPMAARPHRSSAASRTGSTIVTPTRSSAPMTSGPEPAYITCTSAGSRFCSA